MVEYTYENSIEKIKKDNNIVENNKNKKLISDITVNKVTKISSSKGKKNNIKGLNPIVKWSGGKKDELKHLTDNNNEAVKEREADMEKSLKLYNNAKNNFITTEQSNTSITLKDKIEELVAKTNEVEVKTDEINAIQEAINPLQDAKNLTAQIISAIRPMVESENDQERKVINAARAKSAELKDDQGNPINFTAREANEGTSSNKHGMVQSNLFIRAAMENDEKFCLIPTNITVEPAELATLANYGYNLSFRNVAKREPGTDIFSTVPQLRISWEVPNDEKLDSYGLS